MFETIRYLIAAILLVIGVAAAAVSILGVFRFRFVMNRMHCAAIVDTLSMAAICGGLMVATGSIDYIPKLLVALILLWVGSPIASHLVGRMELSTDDTADSHLKKEDDTHGHH